MKAIYEVAEKGMSDYSASSFTAIVQIVSVVNTYFRRPM